MGQKKGFRHLLGVALILMMCAAAVAVWAALRHRNNASPPRDNLPQNVARRQSSITYRRSEQGEQLFTVHAAHMLAYGRGSGSLLEDVHVVIFGKAGDRHDEIQTERCRYNDETGALGCSGEATIVLESGVQIAQGSAPSAKPPVLLHTSGVFYDPRRSTVTTNQPVRFQYGLISGAAVGLDYNTQKGQLDLRKSVAAELPVREPRQSVARITAGELLYSRQRSQILLRGSVNVSDGGKRLQASAGAVYLNAQGQATKIVLTGGVYGYSPLSPGSLRGTAAKLTALVDPATSQIRRLVASGSVRLAVQKGTDGGERRLFAQTAQVNFGRTGKAQTGFASGQVRMVYVPTAGTRK
ncbi:MAG: LPS export ABC transporter periplasmic protein LptC, partial [Terriglobia bacterium]